VAANLRHTISMQPMKSHFLLLGAHFFYFGGGWGWGGVGSKQRVLKFLDMFPKEFPNSTSLLSYMLPQMLSTSFHLYGGHKGRNSILQNRTFYFGELPQFLFFSDDPIKLSHSKKKKKKLNLRGTSSNE
jgi:hypothetical protein